MVISDSIQANSLALSAVSSERACRLPTASSLRTRHRNVWYDSLHRAISLDWPIVLTFCIDDSTDSKWRYDPSKAAAMIFALIYAAGLAVHSWQAYRYRTWWVWPLIIGLILEVSGYAARCVRFCVIFAVENSHRMNAHQLLFSPTCHIDRAVGLHPSCSYRG